MYERLMDVNFPSLIDKFYQFVYFYENPKE